MPISHLEVEGSLPSQNYMLTSINQYRAFNHIAVKVNIMNIHKYQCKSNPTKHDWETLKEVAISCIIHHFLDHYYMDHSLIYCFSLLYLSVCSYGYLQIGWTPPAIIFSFKDHALLFRFKLCEDGCNPSNEIKLLTVAVG